MTLRNLATKFDSLIKSVTNDIFRGIHNVTPNKSLQAAITCAVITGLAFWTFVIMDWVCFTAGVLYAICWMLWMGIYVLPAMKAARRPKSGSRTISVGDLLDRKDR